MANSATDAPWFWIIGGPNGAGKTTLATEFLDEFPEEPIFVNADEVAQQLSPGSPEDTAILSARLIIKQRDDLLASRKSFAIETTLANRVHLTAAKKAKKKGWKIGLVYVWLDSPEIALDRVSQRVLKGGHNIEEDVVRRRYHRSRKNLKEYIENSDLLYVFNNSKKLPILSSIGVFDGGMVYTEDQIDSLLKLVINENRRK